MRSEFGERYGPDAQRGFESMLEELRCLIVNEHGETVAWKDPVAEFMEREHRLDQVGVVLHPCPGALRQRLLQILPGAKY